MIKKISSPLISLFLLFILVTACAAPALPVVTQNPVLPAIQNAPSPSPVPPTQTPEARIPVVFLGDGAPDDITAAMYLMLDTKINLAGIVVTNGETRPSRAIKKWLDYVYGYMGWANVVVTAGCDCAVDPHPNQFPQSWRDSADNFWGMTLPDYQGKPSALTGADLIIQMANQYPRELVILITGPHTDLALALQKDAMLKDKIKKVVIMGGAVNVAGNIHADYAQETNLVSEWNIWVDALAAKEVFDSGIPLDIIPMDPVPEVELNSAFAQKVGAVNLPGANLMAALWEAEFGWYQKDYIWIYDALAAIAIDHPELFEWVNAPLTVVTDRGPNQGRTILQNGDGGNDHIRYASHAAAQKVLDQLYYIFPPH